MIPFLFKPNKIEISIRGWQDEIEGILSISNCNKKKKKKKNPQVSNTLHECYKNQNLWEGEGGVAFRDYISSFLCVANTYVIFN